MRIALIAVTEKGQLFSQKIRDFLSSDHDVQRYCFMKHTDDDSASFSDIRALVSDIFSMCDALIFICACGIAVRSVAPLIKDKSTDPAVVVCDDCGKFAISILSGHLGGANRLAEIIAEKTGAVPVITTATDTGGKFSPDSFAKANGLIISDLKAAKEIAAAVLDGEKIGLCSDYPYKKLPPEIAENICCRTGICISADRFKKPFDITLSLVPKNIVIGIGCKRWTSCETIEKHLSESLYGAGINEARICSIATIDIKANESGLLEYCEKYNLKLYTYTARELMEVCGDFSKSDFVMSHTGADNVCERSAVKRSGGKLLMRKTSGNGVTAAAAELPVLLDFERKLL